MTVGLGLFDQENVFTPATDAVETKAGVLADGMTLDQFGGVLKAHDLTVEIRHAGDTSVDDFRKAAVAALEDDERFVAVNYLRKAIGQETGGHISPLAAYDADTDRFLILDVSRYKYPPIWVEAAALYGAMNTVDASAGDKTRGYVDRGALGRGRAVDQATACRPLRATSVSSLSEAPRGFFSPRSHWLTRPAVTLR